MFDANYKFWLGGFVEGEGSLVISIIKQDKVIYGILLQPEFNIGQHVNGGSQAALKYIEKFENFIL